MSDKKYRAFLSYSHQDHKRAGQLHRELERFRIPAYLGDDIISEPGSQHNLRPIFRDHDELSSGSDLSKIIKDALSHSESLIVVCSPSAVASRWVNDEIRTFQRLGKSEQIFCFIIDGSPFSGDERECFPEALRNPIDSAGQPVVGPSEPIAADAIGGKEEWEHGKFMLVAGLLGVGLDELLRRDLQRRHKQMFAVAAGSATIAVIMIALTVFAFLSQAEAQRRQADADNLVGFLLGDLREDLYAIGRVDLYSSVAAKAMEYFKSLEDEDARDEVLAQRAEALRQIGDALLQRADMQGAKKAFDESLTISSRLAEQNPERLDWSLALAESHFYVGQIHWQRGHLNAASHEFRKQLSVFDSLATAQPGNPQWLSHSAYAWTNYGRILELTGEYEEALHAYQTVMELFQRQLNLQPGNIDSRLEVGFAHNNLGKLKTTLGQLDEAEIHYREDLKIKEEILDSDQSNNSWREYLASSQFWLGKLLSMRGKLEESRMRNESALSLLNTLVMNDPEGTRNRQRKAAVQTELASICRIERDTECASFHIQKALAELGSLTDASPDNTKFAQDEAYSQLEAAWQAASKDDLTNASILGERAKQTVDQLKEEAPLDRDARKLEALTLLTLGDFSQQAAMTGASDYDWRAVLDNFQQHFWNSKDPKILDLKSRFLARNGLIREGQKVEELLISMGYFSSYPYP